jgi:hypothetical protein
MPAFLVPLHEFNKCHNPEGPGGGQFCADADLMSPGPDDFQKGHSEDVGYALDVARVRLMRESFELGDEVRETMLAVDAHGRDVGNMLVGDEESVEIKEPVWQEWIAKGPVVTAHTHPGSSTFSFDDFLFHNKVNRAGQIRNAKGPLAVTAMQVYGEDGSWYELRFLKTMTAARLVDLRLAFDNKRALANRLANTATTAWAKQQPWWANRPPKTWDLMTETEHVRYAAEKAGALKALEARHARHFRDHAQTIWASLSAQFDGHFEYRAHLTEEGD